MVHQLDFEMFGQFIVHLPNLIVMSCSSCTLIETSYQMLPLISGNQPDVNYFSDGKYSTYRAVFFSFRADGNLIITGHESDLCVFDGHVLFRSFLRTVPIRLPRRFLGLIFSTFSDRGVPAPF